jgi:hypothetical protein
LRLTCRWETSNSWVFRLSGDGSQHPHDSPSPDDETVYPGEEHRGAYIPHVFMSVNEDFFWREKSRDRSGKF